MCNCNNNNEGGNCVAEILRVICVLQQNVNLENALETCDRPMLGGANCKSIQCNTRPVMLYTCCGNGVPFSMPTSKDSTVSCPQAGSDECSNVFRVEKIEGNCCTFRVLARNVGPNCQDQFVATNSFFTMNLDCCCACRCLSDTFVDCLC